MANADIFGAGVSIVVKCNAGELDVCSIQLTTGDYFYGGQFAIPRMSVRVNIGKVVNAAGSRAQITPAQFIQLVRWGPASVKCTVKEVPGLKMPVGLTKGDHTIFSGAIVSVAMDQTAAFDGGGSVAFNLEIEHKVAGLMQGDLSTYPIFGASPVTAGYIVSAQKQQIALAVSNLSSNNVKELTSTIFNLRANPQAGSRTAAIPGENIFNFSSGGDVMKQLAEIDFQFVADGIPSNRRADFYFKFADTLFNAVDYKTTYWDMLQQIVGSLDGWVIPTADKVLVRPSLPLPRQIDKTLSTKEYTKITFNRGRGAPTDIYVGGGAAYGSGVAGTENYIANRMDSLLGLYQLPSKLRRSDMILRYEFPPALNELCIAAGPPVVPGAGELEMLKRYIPQQSQAANTGVPNFAFVKAWLAFRCLQRAACTTGILVFTPLRFDIGIGHGIEVQLPTSDGTTSLGSFVGTVSGFDIMIDAETKTPVSVYRIAGVLEKSVYDSSKSESKNAFASQVAAVAPWCA